MAKVKGKRSPVLGCTITFKDEEERVAFHQFITRDGRNMSRYLHSLVTDAMKQDERIASNMTNVDMDAIRRNRHGFL